MLNYGPKRMASALVTAGLFVIDLLSVGLFVCPHVRTCWAVHSAYYISLLEPTHMHKALLLTISVVESVHFAPLLPKAAVSQSPKISL